MAVVPKVLKAGCESYVFCGSRSDHDLGAVMLGWFVKKTLRANCRIEQQSLRFQILMLAMATSLSKSTRHQLFALP